jgi:hypothetical protein
MQELWGFLEMIGVIWGLGLVFGLIVVILLLVAGGKKKSGD